MWIRSQDEHVLIYCTRIEVNRRSIIYVPLTSNGYNCTLGVYETEERALEILDEIEKQLCSNAEVIKETSNEKFKQFFVFQMPIE